MGKVAFLFPGQGAQYVEMGKEISENFDIAKGVFEDANKAIDMDIKDICFNGPEDELMKTENTQPAILATSIAILKVAKEKGLKADVTAGLSLGEYTSLVYSGAIDFKEAIKLVKKRGRYMQEAVPDGKGAMAAVLGLDRDILGQVIEDCKDQGIISAANFNCPGQIVLSGEVKAIEKAIDLAKQKGAKRAVKLPVSAPFHCEMLKPAGEKLKVALEDIEIKDMNTKVISNVTGEYIESSKDIKDLLVKQVSSSVLFEDSIELMLEDGVDKFIEIGPSKTLSAFVKRIAKNNGKKVKCFNIENLESLDKTLDSFK